MKFYNPFKPHIVTDGEYYAIRKSALFFWKYFDLKEFDFWWVVPEYVDKYCWSKDLISIKNTLPFAKKFKRKDGIKTIRRVDD